MTEKKKLYLANSYGFSEQASALVLPRLKEALEALGLEVWEPFERTKHLVAREPGWAYAVAQLNLQGVKECDGIFAVVNGTPPDEGVMVELGVAIALQKPTFLFRDDLRRCSDSTDYPLNLMVFAGLPEISWQDYFYSSLNELSSSKKALVRWAASTE